MKIQKFLKIIAFFAILFAATNIKAQLVDTISINDFSDYVSKGYVVIDIDSPVHYKAGHIDGALNLNYLDEDFNKRLSAYDPNANYIIYGRTTSTPQALQIFRNAGFRNIYMLNGGYDTWKFYQDMHRPINDVK